MLITSVWNLNLYIKYCKGITKIKRGTLHSGTHPEIEQGGLPNDWEVLASVANPCNWPILDTTSTDYWEGREVEEEWREWWWKLPWRGLRLNKLNWPERVSLGQQGTSVGAPLALPWQNTKRRVTATLAPDSMRRFWFLVVHNWMFILVTVSRWLFCNYYRSWTHNRLTLLVKKSLIVHNMHC